MEQNLLFNLPQESQTFNNFLAIGNEIVVQTLHKALQETESEDFCIFLTGENGSGRTHLLQATFFEAQEKYKQKDIAYIACSKDLPPEILEGLEHKSLLCLDDIDKVLGDKKWEETLFYIYNEMQNNNQTLLVSAKNPPKQLNFLIPDLKSRFSQALIYKVNELNDEQKITAIIFRFKNLGIEVKSNVAKLILNKFSRNMHQIFTLIHQLDVESWQRQTKVNANFVKDFLNIN